MEEVSNSIDYGLADEVIKSNGVGSKDVDEVFGNDDLIMVYAESLSQYRSIIDAAEKKGICDHYREMIGPLEREYKIVLRRYEKN